MKHFKAFSLSGRNWLMLVQVLLLFAVISLLKSTLTLFEASRSVRETTVSSSSSSKSSRTLVTNKPETNPLKDPLTAVLPKRIQLNNSETYKLVEQESNLAVNYWEEWKRYKQHQPMLMKENVNFCHNVQLTAPYNLKHNNLYWQQYDAPPDKTVVNSTVELNMYLYNAYYDVRVRNTPVVRILTENNHELMGNSRKWWCLLWFDYIKQPILVPVSQYYNIWPTSRWRKSIDYGHYHPQIISCPVPPEYVKDVPRAVSLTSSGECSKISKEPSNILRVIYQKRSKNQQNSNKPSIGICLQALRFGTYDMSVRLVEWLEMVRLLGADQVHLYSLGITESMRKVLRHYQDQKFVDWRPSTLPGTQLNINSYYNLLAYETRDYFWPSETLELNDCLYRNLYLHDYIAVLDIDEVIMPQRWSTWQDMLMALESQNLQKDIASYYSIPNALVCEHSTTQQETTRNNQAIPNYLYMARHTMRSEISPSAHRNKYLLKTSQVTAAHIHEPAACLNTTGHFQCTGITVHQKDSILMHYRRDKHNPNEMRKCFIHDRTVLRYYDVMQRNVLSELKKIFL